MRLIYALILLLAASFCYAQEMPTVNLPEMMRQQNWRGSMGEGSCVHASMVTLLRWQGQYEMADWWKANNGNGEYSDRMARKLEAAGVRFAYTDEGDEAFLDWCFRTRRGCNITWMGGRHMLTLVYLDAKQACILDNNSTDQYQWMSREQMLAEWRASYGWAVCPVYDPLPPVPWR